MPYLTGALLFLAPFALYALWLRVTPEGRSAPLGWLAAAAAGVLLSVAVSVWYGSSRSMAPGEAYVPPRIEDGRIVPGSGSRAPGSWPPVPPRGVPPPHQGPAPPR